MPEQSPRLLQKDRVVASPVISALEIPEKDVKPTRKHVPGRWTGLFAGSLLSAVFKLAAVISVLALVISFTGGMPGTTTYFTSTSVPDEVYLRTGAWQQEVAGQLYFELLEEEPLSALACVALDTGKELAVVDGMTGGIAPGAGTKAYDGEVGEESTEVGAGEGPVPAGKTTLLAYLTLPAEFNVALVYPETLRLCGSRNSTPPLDYELQIETNSLVLYFDWARLSTWLEVVDGSGLFTVTGGGQYFIFSAEQVIDLPVSEETEKDGTAGETEDEEGEALPGPASIEIIGPTVVTVPEEGDLAVSYTASVADSGGAVLSDCSLTWQMEGGAEGVAFLPETAVLTVSSAASPCELTLVAFTGIEPVISAQITVTLINDESEGSGEEDQDDSRDAGETDGETEVDGAAGDEDVGDEEARDDGMGDEGVTGDGEGETQDGDSPAGEEAGDNDGETSGEVTEDSGGETDGEDTETSGEETDEELVDEVGENDGGQPGSGEAEADGELDNGEETEDAGSSETETGGAEETPADAEDSPDGGTEDAGGVTDTPVRNEDETGTEADEAQEESETPSGEEDGDAPEENGGSGAGEQDL